MCRTATTNMSTKTPYEGNRIVPRKELARCFGELKESLGRARAMVETITYELEIMFDIVPVGKLSYKLSQIEDVLTKLLGDSASKIMIESIVRHLDNQEKYFVRLTIKERYKIMQNAAERSRHTQSIHANT